MTVLLYPLQWLALAGFVCSVAVHVMALLHMSPPALLQPYFEVEMGVLEFLSIGIFAVWVPTVLLASRVSHVNRMGRVSWSALLAGCPAWMRKVGGGLFAYAFVNFFLAIAADGSAANDDGSLAGHRAFSGHWMLFYGMAYAVMYSITRKPKLLQKRQCVAGHAVGQEDRFCPTCGQTMLPDAE